MSTFLQLPLEIRHLFYNEVLWTRQIQRIERPKRRRQGALSALLVTNKQLSIEIPKWFEAIRRQYPRDLIEPDNWFMRRSRRLTGPSAFWNPTTVILVDPDGLYKKYYVPSIYIEEFEALRRSFLGCREMPQGLLERTLQFNFNNEQIPIPSTGRDGRHWALRHVRNVLCYLDVVDKLEPRLQIQKRTCSTWKLMDPRGECHQKIKDIGGDVLLKELQNEGCKDFQIVLYKED